MPLHMMKCPEVDQVLYYCTVAHMFVRRMTGHQDFQHGNILRALHEVKGDNTNQRGWLEAHHLSDGILCRIYRNCNNYGNFAAVQRYSST